MVTPIDNIVSQIRPPATQPTMTARSLESAKKVDTSRSSGENSGKPDSTPVSQPDQHEVDVEA